MQVKDLKFMNVECKAKIDEIMELRLAATKDTELEVTDWVTFNTCSCRIWKDCFTGKLMSKAIT
jgi:hypothetical protein